MIQAQLPHFKELHSVELGEKLHAAAAKKFAEQEKVKLHQGDSGKVIKRIVPGFKKPVLFWLDGHYSGGVTAKADLDTPVKEELETILTAEQNHIILIDDAREFREGTDYSTVYELCKLVEHLNPAYTVSVANDIFKVEPKKQ